MNTKKSMIIIKGEIKTSEVKYCDYNNTTKKWDIEFNSGGIYSYIYPNVERLNSPEELDPSVYRISRAGKVLSNIESIYVFKSSNSAYYHICFENGSERDYKQSELSITKSCLSEEQPGKVFEYIKQIASLSSLKDEKTGKKFLAKKFEKIDFVGDDIALAKYLKPGLLQKNSRRIEYTPIFPFGCNNSQYKAVKRAMENSISVIQGPPGTGKTQTILNIIANILIQGKTVQIVANNNSATENVYEKLSSSQYGLGFIVATLGKSENKKAFIREQDVAYPDFSQWKLVDNEDITLDSVKEMSRQLKKIFDMQKELADLKQEQLQLETELIYFNEYLHNQQINLVNLKIKRKMSSQNWMDLWQECQIIYEEKGRFGLLFKIKQYFNYGMSHLNVYENHVVSLISTIQEKFYSTKAKELSTRISEIEKFLSEKNSNLLNDMCVASMAILKDSLANKYSKKTSRTLFTENDLYQRPYEFLGEYPVILSTTFSSSSSLNQDVVYDYIIMDEASQVDVATGALALSCAKNVVIVGDTKQLPNVVKKSDEKKAKEIFDTFNINEGYQFTKSFLQSILDVLPDVTQTMLREHYRCHPKIINFCNQKFYRGELIIMTEDKGENDVLGVVKTVKGNHARNRYSQRQIDVIKEEIIPKYVDDKKGTGIIAPYKNQAEALENEFKDIDASTVHKFQGREKDTIIISTVDDEITDFADDPYLINVAVSRAKKKLLLTVTGNEQTKERNILDLVDYIQYNNFEVTDSKVYSIFDYLYKQYSAERRRYLEKHKKISDFDSENIMYATLEDILIDNKYASLDVVCHFPMHMLIKDTSLLNERESQYAMHPNTHIDFLIFNRISKKPFLAIEVDGYRYHKAGTAQAKRDSHKNYIMELYGIPLLRLVTNGSGEEPKIRAKLDELMG